LEYVIRKRKEIEETKRHGESWKVLEDSDVLKEAVSSV